MASDRLRLRDIRNTSTFRLTLLLGVVAAVGLVALVALVYLLSASELGARTDRVLRLEAAKLSRVSAETLPERVDAEVAHNVSGLTYIALQSPEGEHVAGNLRVATDFPLDRPIDVPARAGSHPPIRVLAIRAPTGETILIGRDTTPLLDLRRRVTSILVVSGFGIAAAVLAAGVMLSRRPLRRVRDLRAACMAIAAGRFGDRMPVSRRGDELDLFATTVNTMVEEVARVVAQVKDVTDAIAHDLRTPLAHVRAQLRHIAQLPADPAAAAIARAAIVDLDQVLERFAALLRISELEASGRRSSFALVPLAPLAEAVRDLWEPVAEEREIALLLATDADAAAECDEKLVFEALSNLVDNALKFTPAGGEVRLAVEARPEGASLSVCDDGPGIAADERDAVLHRFRRGAGSDGAPGTGLGLSVVAAIVHLHGFALALEDAGPGLCVRIRCAPGGAR